jgi:hypothetical protein
MRAKWFEGELLQGSQPGSRVAHQEIEGIMWLAGN